MVELPGDPKAYHAGDQSKAKPAQQSALFHLVRMCFRTYAGPCGITYLVIVVGEPISQEFQVKSWMTGV